MLPRRKVADKLGSAKFPIEYAEIYLDFCLSAHSLSGLLHAITSPLPRSEITLPESPEQRLASLREGSLPAGPRLAAAKPLWRSKVRGSVSRVEDGASKARPALESAGHAPCPRPP
jgi:hypothetical protein